MTAQTRVLGIHERFQAELRDFANHIWLEAETAGCAGYMNSIWCDFEHFFQSLLRLNKPVEKLGKDTPTYSTMLKFPLLPNVRTLSPDQLQTVRAEITKLKAFLNQFLVAEVLEKDDRIWLFIDLG